jgi:hypothetical protein
MALAACGAAESEAPTPYQPYGEYGGYYEQHLGSNRWLVSFRGNAYTTEETATAYVYRRAGEVCRGDFDLVSEHSFDKVEVEGYRSWGGGMVARDRSVKPRRELVVACKPARPAPPPSPGSAGAVSAAPPEVDAGSGGSREAPTREVPF